MSIVLILGEFLRELAGPALGPQSAFMVTVRNASCTIVDPRNGSGDGDMATMMVVVGDGGGGGKYGTPGAGVIIYLAPEIGPADTAGRFNGRTMLELTKTKTKHQLGDFFFHFSFASFTFAHHSVPFFLSHSPFLPPRPLYSLLFGHVEEEERRRCVQCICVVHLYHPWLTSSRTSDESAHLPSRSLPPPPFPRAATKSHALKCIRILWRPGSRIVSDNG